MNIKQLPLAVMAFALYFCQSAIAANITNVWSVSSTTKLNCSTGAHGLWTNSLNPGTGACNDFFDLDGDISTLTEFDNNTAVLEATAVNPAGIIANINIEFGTFTTSHTAVKTGGGEQLPSWYYYESIVSGLISIESTDYDITLHGSDFVLQIGHGANDKTSVFGGSVWLDANGGSYTGGHWDINMQLSPVPVPAAVWLFASGLFAIIAVARRKT